MKRCALLLILALGCSQLERTTVELNADEMGLLQALHTREEMEIAMQHLDKFPGVRPATFERIRALAATGWTVRDGSYVADCRCYRVEFARPR